MENQSLRFISRIIGFIAVAMYCSCADHAVSTNIKKNAITLIDSGNSKKVHDTDCRVVFNDSTLHVEERTYKSSKFILIKYGKYCSVTDNRTFDYFISFYELSNVKKLYKINYYSIGDKLFLAFYNELSKDSRLDEFNKFGDQLKYVASWGLNRHALFIYPTYNLVVSSRLYPAEDGFMDVYLKAENYKNSKRTTKKFPKINDFENYEFEDIIIQDQICALNILKKLDVK